MGILIKEHHSTQLLITSDTLLYTERREKYLLNNDVEKIKIQPRTFKREKGKDYQCYSCNIFDNKIILNSDYFVGIDWLTQERFIHVEPKLNFSITDAFEKAGKVDDESISEEEIIQFDKEAEHEAKKVTNEKEINVVGMLIEIMSHPDLSDHTDDLVLIDWEMPEIPIHQKQDLITPFLVVKFLNLLKDITRKGLKKSYYKVQENLINRIKGKVLVGQQIKQNILRNRFTNTVCEYQVFGEDSTENRFLKRVFQFCVQYVENNKNYFGDKNDISWLINYIRPVFENIGLEINLHEIKNYKHNPFFKEYKEAIKVGNFILKRFSYNITKTTDEKISTPPFWIDMPKMFELFVFSKLLEDNSELTTSNFKYQYSTYGNSLDFLICNEKSQIKIVVDAKYKLHYNYGQIHQDIRQVSGYARLTKVKNELPDVSDEIPCLIIYPKASNEDSKENNLAIDNLLIESNRISMYSKVYKIGVELPLMS